MQAANPDVDETVNMMALQDKIRQHTNLNFQFDSRVCALTVIPKLNQMLYLVVSKDLFSAAVKTLIRQLKYSNDN